MKDIVFYDAITAHIGEEKKLPSTLDRDVREFSDELEKVKTKDEVLEIIERYESKRIRRRLWDATGHDTAVAYDKILKELTQ